MIQAKHETSASKDLADESFNIAQQARDRSERVVNESSELVKKLEQFLNSPGAAPVDIRRRAVEVSCVTIIKYIYICHKVAYVKLHLYSSLYGIVSFSVSHS